MTVEVHFVGLAILLTQTHSGWLNLCDFCLLDGFGFAQRFKLVVELDELELQAVEHFKFLVVKELLVVFDPDIFQLNVEDVVEHLFYFVLCFEAADRRKCCSFLLFLDIVLTALLEIEPAVSWFDGGVET